MFTFLVVLLGSTRCSSPWSSCCRRARAAGSPRSAAGRTDTVLGGRQAVTILTKLTWWCGGIFLLLSLVLSFVPRGGNSSALAGAAPGGDARRAGAAGPAAARTGARHRSSQDRRQSW